MGNRKSKEDKALSPYSSWGHSLDNLLCGDGKVCEDRWTPISLRSREGSPFSRRGSRARSAEYERDYARDDYLDNRRASNAPSVRSRRVSDAQSVYDRRQSYGGRSRRKSSVITVQPLPVSYPRRYSKRKSYVSEGDRGDLGYESDFDRNIQPLSPERVHRPTYLEGRDGREYELSDRYERVEKRKRKKKKTKPKKLQSAGPTPSPQPVQIFIDMNGKQARNVSGNVPVQVIRKGKNGRKLKRIGSMPTGLETLRDSYRSKDTRKYRTVRAPRSEPSMISTPKSSTISSLSTVRKVVPPRKKRDQDPPAPFRVTKAPENLLAIRRLNTSYVLGESGSRR